MLYCLFKVNEDWEQQFYTKDCLYQRMNNSTLSCMTHFSGIFLSCVFVILYWTEKHQHDHVNNI